MAEPLARTDRVRNEANRRRVASPKRTPAVVEYPDCDGMPMETLRHYFAGMHAVAVLMRHFGKGMHFGANNGVYYREGDPSAVIVPDVYAVTGKPQTLTDTYLVWEQPLPPDFVLELASKSSYRRDKVVKRDIYAGIGVKDYFMFDPTGRYLDEPLLGFRLDAGASTPIEPTRLPDGGLSLRSDVLKIELRAWLGVPHPTLRFFDPATGSYLLSAEEEAAQVERRLKEAERGRQEAERRHQEAERRQHETKRRQQENEETIAALRMRLADFEARQTPAGEN